MQVNELQEQKRILSSSGQNIRIMIYITRFNSYQHAKSIILFLNIHYSCWALITLIIINCVIFNINCWRFGKFPNLILMEELQLLKSEKKFFQDSTTDILCWQISFYKIPLSKEKIHLILLVFCFEDFKIYFEGLETYCFPFICKFRPQVPSVYVGLSLCVSACSP